MEQKEISGEQFRQMSVSSRSPSRQHKLTINVSIGWLITVIIVGILAFLAGVHVGKQHPKSPSSLSINSRRFNVSRRARLSVFGTVSAVSSSSIAVQNFRTGNSNTYNITSSTKITDNGRPVSYNNIAVGATVLITKTNTSSSNAQLIIINPSFGGGGT